MRILFLSALAALVLAGCEYTGKQSYTHDGNYAGVREKTYPDYMDGYAGERSGAHGVHEHPY
ncbi:MAG: hypothetical protein HY720_29045 [Planctomycetes bacterium]|nr:hypothetical protein [Planctomycetota bacterium]